MNLERERELFKQAYINLRSGSNIPFPDDVFDEYLRLREEEGYKMVPLEASKACLSNLGDVIFDNFGTTTAEVDRCAEKAYKAMLGSVE